MSKIITNVFFLLSVFIFLSPNFILAESSLDPLVKAFVCKSSVKSNEGQELLAKTQTAYAAVNTLQAKFAQFSKVLGMTENIPSSGNIIFKKPGKMDWNYQEPDEQRFISDGETVWFYEPKVNQVTIGQLNKSFSSDVPVSFLIGLGEISKSFTLSSTCISELGYVFELAPISETSSFKTFYLLVSRDTYIPHGAKIIDQGDTLTQFIFSDVRVGEDVLDKHFYFQTPKGVDIVYNN